MVAAILTLCAFGLFFIYPDYAVRMEQKTKIDALDFKLRKQKMLLPLHRLLMDQMEFFQQSDRFSNRKPEPCQLEEVIRRIRSLSQSHQFDLKKVDADKPVLNNSLKTFTISMVMSGAFINLNPYLKQLQSLPCMVDIELIQIQTLARFDEITLQLSVPAG